MDLRRVPAALGGLHAITGQGVSTIDRLTPEKRSWIMSRIKGKDTRPEIALRSLLHRAGFRFRIHSRTLAGRPDIVLPKYKTVVFLHGCFWHRHEECKYAYTPKSRQEFWLEKFSETVKRDKLKKAELQSMGWQVLTVWECELSAAPAVTLEGIISKLPQG
jgi:DNA mismatch endonuclease, patch repair protein